MHLIEFGQDGCVARQALAMQPLDQLMSRLSALVVGMVAVAEQELATRRGMLPDTPAARLVAGVFSDQPEDTRAERAEDAELFNVRAEPGPEPVVGAGLVDGSGVYLEPVTSLRCVHEPDNDAHHGGTGQPGYDRTPFHRCSPPPIQEPSAYRCQWTGNRGRRPIPPSNGHIADSIC